MCGYCYFTENGESQFFVGRKFSDFGSPFEAEQHFKMAQQYIIRQDQLIRRLYNRISELEAKQK